MWALLKRRRYKNENYQDCIESVVDILSIATILKWSSRRSKTHKVLGKTHLNVTQLSVKTYFVLISNSRLSNFSSRVSSVKMWMYGISITLAVIATATTAPVMLYSTNIHTIRIHSKRICAYTVHRMLILLCYFACVLHCRLIESLTIISQIYIHAHT